MDLLTVSSKGQISIPAKARRKMKISQGDKLAYMVFDDTLVIKPVKVPSNEEFKESLDEAKSWAEEVGLTEDDISDAIRTVRKRNRH